MVKPCSPYVLQVTVPPFGPIPHYGQDERTRPGENSSSAHDYSLSAPALEDILHR